MSNLTDLMGGAIGYFWTALDDFDALDRARPGHVRLSDDGDLLLDLLPPHEEPSSENPLPTSLVATTSVGGALFVDVHQGRLAGPHGGYRVSTRTNRAIRIRLRRTSRAGSPTARRGANRSCSTTRVWSETKSPANSSPSSPRTTESTSGARRGWRSARAWAGRGPRLWGQSGPFAGSGSCTQRVFTARCACTHG